MPRKFLARNNEVEMPSKKEPGRNAQIERTRCKYTNWKNQAEIPS